METTVPGGLKIKKKTLRAVCFVRSR